MALNGWFLRTIREAEVPIRTDRPVPRLTTEGPFRHSRNPSYLALAMVYAGIAVLRNSLWAILLLPLVVLVIQREVIGREERYLERAFGEEYLAYKAQGATLGVAGATSEERRQREVHRITLPRGWVNKSLRQ